MAPIDAASRVAAATATIEVSHRNIIHLLKIITDALAALSEVTIPDTYMSLQRHLWDEAKMITDRYRIGVSPFIVAYYTGICTSVGADADHIRSAYWDFVNHQDIIGSIDGCMRRIDVLTAGIGISADHIATIATSRHGYGLAPTVERVTVPTGCDCGGAIGCPTCAAWEPADVTDDTRLPMADAGKTKQGRHHPHVHCKSWVARLQAWDGPTVPDDVIKRLQVCCRRDRVNKKKMTCAQVRKYLKELKLTDYNVCVPFIRKLLTGIAPPQLTADELDQLYSIFDRVAAAMKRMRPDNNITYYPYIIYKILDSTLQPGSRKAQILECVHLQSNKTMRLVDKIYAPICHEVDELQAKPTNKHEYDTLL